MLVRPLDQNVPRKIVEICWLRSPDSDPEARQGPNDVIHSISILAGPRLGMELAGLPEVAHDGEMFQALLWMLRGFFEVVFMLSLTCGLPRRKCGSENTAVQDLWGLEVCNGFGVWGALSPKIASVFIRLVRISRYRPYVLQFFTKY